MKTFFKGGNRDVSNIQGHQDDRCLGMSISFGCAEEGPLVVPLGVADGVDVTAVVNEAVRSWSIDQGGPRSEAAIRPYWIGLGQVAVDQWDSGYPEGWNPSYLGNDTRLRSDGVSPRPVWWIWLLRALGAGIAAAIGWDLWQEVKHHFWDCADAIIPGNTEAVMDCVFDIVAEH